MCKRYPKRLKKHLTPYTATYPDYYQLFDNNEDDRLRFEIDKHRVSIRLTVPYTKEHKEMASHMATANL